MKIRHLITRVYFFNLALLFIFNCYVFFKDYDPLQEALKSAERFLSDINENVRVIENQERYDWLQRCVQNDLNIVFNSETNKLGPRKLIHFGIVTKVTDLRSYFLQIL